MDFDYDVIVIGGGHAGVEASFASAKMGMNTLLVTLNKKMIANTPCNPHIGGSAKGIVVREIDALGGLMGIAADHHPLQIKMLNMGKGPGVRCLRAQVDKEGYPAYVQSLLENVPNLSIKECEVKALLYDDKKVFGIKTEKEEITSKAVIITTGTYMESSIISGKDVHAGGPDGENSSIGLSACLREMGIETFRLKTGTPPRIKKSTIDFSKAEIEAGMDGELAFSFKTKKFTPLSEQLPCYLIYTTQETIDLIQKHLDESAVFNGTIKGVGPRYCPSIESKVVRFADKERHQLFLEPETEFGESIYLQGFSTGFPHALQEELVHTLPGLEKAEILKYAYQIEYDAVKPLQFDATLHIKKYEGLYGAGQIVGTSGYEEAGGLGLMAGINAALWIKGEAPFVLRRDEAYIGVMIDDLVTKGTEEPYRLLSSRAEYRLLLRHDNADLRLSEYGHKLGLLDEQDYQAFLEKYRRIDEAIEIMKRVNVTNKAEMAKILVSLSQPDAYEGHNAYELLKRPFVTYKDIQRNTDELKKYDFDEASCLALETRVKFQGYIARAEKEAKENSRLEGVALPDDLDYSSLEGLRLEAREKLAKVHPLTLGEASRISGVNPADISILILILKREGKI